jgi:hypothetical protein
MPDSVEADCQFLFGIAAGPIWMLLGYRLGKHHAAICGELIQPNRLGFDPKSLHNGPAALHGLLLVFALGLAISHLISAGLITGFPLDAVRHAEIRRRLELRDSETATRTIR